MSKAKSGFYTLSFHLHEVAPYINWLYFFHAWGFPARLGSIAKVHGCEACRKNWLQAFSAEERPKAQEAMRLYDDAQRLLQALDNTYHTHARIALLPAYSEQDNIFVYAPTQDNSTATNDGSKAYTIDGSKVYTNDESKAATKRICIPLLRQQTPSHDGCCLCLSDFIKPKPHQNEEMHPLYNTIGVFACATDREMEEQHADDEYLHLLHQTLADRLAEATAEKMHEYVRNTLWGYASHEHFSLEELFAEAYQGKRPAIGYPSLPDQSLNFVLDDILNFSSIGISLTENGAMIPHASTSGLMLAHPATQHFSIGQIGDDQMEEYAQRRHMKLEEIRKFLRN